jgi:hypothetical protein
MKKYLVYIISGILALIMTITMVFLLHSNANVIAQREAEISSLQNKLSAAQQAESLKTQTLVANENGLSVDKVNHDKAVLEAFLKDVFTWSSYKEYEATRQKIMTTYNIAENSDFMKIFMPKVVNRELNGKDYNRIDLNKYNLTYQNMKPYITKISPNEYSYFVEVSIVSSAENEGSATVNAVFEATVATDGTIKNVSAVPVTER